MKLTGYLTVLDVIPADDAWVIVADGSVVGSHNTRKKAAEMARAMAMLSKPSRLIVRGSDGEIETITPFEDDGCHC